MLVHFRVYGLPPHIFIQGLAVGLRRIGGLPPCACLFSGLGFATQHFISSAGFGLRKFWLFRFRVGFTAFSA